MPDRSKKQTKDENRDPDATAAALQKIARKLGKDGYPNSQFITILDRMATALEGIRDNTRPSPETKDAIDFNKKVESEPLNP